MRREDGYVITQYLSSKIKQAKEFNIGESR